MTKNNIKILVIGGYSFDGDDATSITLKSLFGSFSKESIAFINTNNKNVNNTYRNIIIFPKLFKNISSNNVVKKLSQKRSLIHGIPNTFAINELSQRSYLLNYIHTIGSSYRSLIGYKYTESIDDFIREFNPDVLYSVLGNVAVMNLCSKISKKFNIPIIPHFMDNWIEVMFSKNGLLFPAKYVLNKSLKKLFNHTKFGYAISQKMANEYEAKYHIKFYTLMNCVDIIENVDPLISINIKRPINIIYAGGLHIGRASSLLLLCKCLNKINNYQFVFNIYTNEKDWESNKNLFIHYKFIKYGGFLSQQKIQPIIKSSEILVHAESFEENLSQYTRLSISTKIPEYLASGKVLIAIGPPNIASIEYLRENKCAIIIDTNSLCLIRTKVESLLSNSCIGITTNAIRTAKNFHSKRNQIDTLLNTLNIIKKL